MKCYEMIYILKYFLRILFFKHSIPMNLYGIYLVMNLLLFSEGYNVCKHM